MVLKMEAKKEHGLLFQPDMARSNVAGLKTMTRRAINPQPPGWADGATRAFVANDAFRDWFGRNGKTQRFKCPWAVGDLIYQKERWRVGSQDRNTIWYDDGNVKVLRDTAENLAGKFLGDKNKSPLFMYAWAARFWADIVSIKVERVRDISAEDCIKEGIQERHGGFMVGYTLPEYGPQPVGIVHKTPVAAYKELYNGINGPGSFDRDWGWVIEYRRVER